MDIKSFAGNGNGKWRHHDDSIPNGTRDTAKSSKGPEMAKAMTNQSEIGRSITEQSATSINQGITDGAMIHVTRAFHLAKSIIT
jgi:hypothetical protein